jgi:hypothetical protein
MNDSLAGWPGVEEIRALLAVAGSHSRAAPRVGGCIPCADLCAETRRVEARGGVPLSSVVPGCPDGGAAEAVDAKRGCIVTLHEHSKTRNPAESN